MKDYNKCIEANKDLWNTKTPLHLESDFYDNESFKKNGESLKDIEKDLLGDVKGQKIIHLQCHFGQDSISLARMGAEVTGVDISDKSIDAGRQLNEEMGTDVNFVCSNIYDIPDSLFGKFDTVFVSYGALCWIPDLDKYADIVNKLLKPGGRFVLVEMHPFIYLYEFDQQSLKYPYFTNGEVIIEEVEGTYGSKDSHDTKMEYSWIHTISDMIRPYINKGMALTHFEEYEYMPYNCFPHMVEVGPGKYAYDPHKVKIPQTFSMVCRKPK